MDDAARAGLRNASFRHGLTLWTANPIMGLNGATLVAAIGAPDFFSRDRAAGVLGPGWGSEASIRSWRCLLRLPADAGRRADTLERSSTPDDSVRIIQFDPGRPVKQFGAGMVSRVLKANLKAPGLWKPGQLAATGYSDGYLKAPLPVLMMFRTVAALRDALAPKGVLIPFDVVTEPLRDDR